jgi:hypothetical protein
MAVTNFSPLLGLALPTTGDLSGTWGTTVNDAITSLIDSAVAGTTTLSANSDVTLSTTNGAANQARNAVILWTASNGATTRVITAPAQSKAYIVINSGTGSVTVKASGRPSGPTIASGFKALIAFNGTDFVTIASSLVNLTSDVTGTLPVANGGTGQTSYTDGQLLIGNSSGNTLTKATLTQGSGVTITNGNGTIQISATGSGGTITSVTASLPISSSGGSAPNLSFLAPGTAGNVLTSTGSAWASSALPSGSSLKRSARTSNTILGTADQGYWIDVTSGTFTQTFTAAATLGDGWWCYYGNSGTGAVTLDPNGSETIDGLTSFVVYPNEIRAIQCTGTAFNSFVVNAFDATFTSTTSVVIPPGYLQLKVDAVGGGGGGGTGVVNTSGSYRYGPGAGGGGARVITTVNVPTAGSSVTATVGAGGTAGVAGGSSSFNNVVAYGGGGGAGGGTSNVEFGGGGGGGGLLSVGSNGSINVNPSIAPGTGGSPVVSGSTSNVSFGGGNGSASAIFGGGGGGIGYLNSGGAGGGSLYGPAGGGSGTGMDGGNATGTGGVGGTSNSYTTGGGGAGGTNGGSGTAGTTNSVTGMGTGGGGGSCKAATNGGSGGAGGFPGGGGGGGASADTGYSAGTGGTGGAGQVRISGVF